MSSKNNVNPDYYKSGGRDKQGDDLPPEPRAGAAVPSQRRKKGDGPPANFIPGAAPVGEAPPEEREKPRR
jgi:hypothetical protein